MVKFYAYRKHKKWVVHWRAATGNMLSHSFLTEQEAQSFEHTLQLVAPKEHALLKRRKKKQKVQEKITVTDLLEQYLASLVNPTTRKQNRYHAAHLVRAFGQRQAGRLTPNDAMTFMSAQQLRGDRELPPFDG